MGKHAASDVLDSPAVETSGGKTVVFGRPVSGDIRRGDNQAAQADPAEFIEALDRLLSVPEVESVVLTGYVPWFNDGDECTFGVREYESGIKLTKEGYRLYTLSEVNEDYDDDLIRFEDDDRLSDRRWEYNPELRSGNYVDVEVPEQTKILISEVNAFLKHFGTQHYDFLQQAFGRHFKVTCTKNGFDVEYYEHD